MSSPARPSDKPSFYTIAMLITVLVFVQMYSHQAIVCDEAWMWMDFSYDLKFTSASSHMELQILGA